MCFYIGHVIIISPCVFLVSYFGELEFEGMGGKEGKVVGREGVRKLLQEVISY